MPKGSEANEPSTKQTAGPDRRHVLVTGAGSGIGRAVALRLAQDGARLGCVDLDSAAAGEAAAEAGDDAFPIQMDVCEESSVKLGFDHAEKAFGGGLDVLVNVAGVGSTTAVPETPTEVWDRVSDVNARGTFLCCKYAIPRLAARGGGAIVNMASVAGMVGLRNRAAYCASKGAVIALTRAMALDHVSDRVRVNCVCPGTIDTPWVRRLVDDEGESLNDLIARQPLGRLGTPEEVAESVHYLASDRAAYVTGTALVIDGGMTAG